MVRFDYEKFKYLKGPDFRVEVGMKNHEFVPSQLLYAVANCKGGKTFSILKDLCRQKLLVYEKSSQGESYRLTFAGYDVLAMNVLIKRDVINQFGSKIGVGKESDIYIACDSQNKQHVIKFHRLGRNSFRKVKEKRDYMGSRRHTSWLYLSRLSAMKEYQFLKILHQNGFPVPKPIDYNRHCIVMELIEGYPFCQVNTTQNASTLYNECISLIVKFAQYGLIHGDFSEYNLIYCENYKNDNIVKSKSDDEASISTPTFTKFENIDIENNHNRIVVIDFPQMVSTDHMNAEYYFNRDVKCIRDLFKRKFNFIAEEYPTLNDVVRVANLDKEVFASGFNKKMDSDLIEQLENMSVGSCDSKSDDTPVEPNNTSTVDDVVSNDESKHLEELPNDQLDLLCETKNPPTPVDSDDACACADQNNLDQIYELLDSERIEDPIVNDQSTEKKSMAYSTFTTKEITDKIKDQIKTEKFHEKHKRALRLAIKRGDSYRSRLRRENKSRVKESMCDEF